jgi:hypothetical protein
MYAREGSLKRNCVLFFKWVDVWGLESVSKMPVFLARLAFKAFLQGCTLNHTIRQREGYYGSLTNMRDQTYL